MKTPLQIARSIIMDSEGLYASESCEVRIAEAIQAERERVGILEIAVKTAANTFREYEQNHRLKNTRDGNLAADANGFLARAMETAIDLTKGQS